ncbi:MAG TPA: SLBB domain-containing protein [Rhizomicrobium sp.]|nr:SLBB domain-containing protein [Rhizomicrobium sp.]
MPAAPAAAPAMQPAAADLGYILGAEDVIQVDVLGQKDFSARSKVGADGKIQLPLLGSFPAANRSVLQLREDIAQALQSGGFFNKPIVDVVVASYASRYVTVLGAVGTPGLIPVDRPYRLSEILARVGGVKEGGADHVVLRTKDDVARNYAIRDLATGDINLDPYVQPGDKIFAPTADMFYIKGQVKGPGGYGLIPHMTLLMAIARAGGLTELGSDSHIKIMRKNTTLSPKDLNIEVLPDDVIDVGEGWF